jgi:predicted TIM-barrel fold metal-dependent hydrolase
LTVIDLSDLPVVDAHCHSYLESPKALSADDFARYASILSVQPDFLDGKFTPSKKQLALSHARLARMYREQPFFNHMIKLLSQYYHCEPELEAVTTARSTRAANFDAYAKDLFDDARIRGLVLDGGYPPLKTEDLKRFPATVVRVFRLETFIKDLLTRHDSFSEFCTQYERGIEDAIGRDGYVGLKSIIAYRTGLEIRRVELKDAKKDFLAAKKGRAETAWYGPKVKKLRDFLVIRAMELSIDLNVPMQLHTGVGDFDILLDRCDPSLMYELLKDEKLRHATVVLVHSGFPNNQNAAFMASALPNVFLDFSLTIPFLNPASSERLLEILEIAPSSKIMYGSDGFNLPELFWLSAKVGKRILEECFVKLLQERIFDENEISQKAKQILFANANELYRVGLT